MHFLETIGGHFRQVAAKTDLERRFRLAYQDEEAENLSRLINLILLMFHSSAILVVPITTMPSLAGILLGIHAGLLTLNLVSWFMYRGGKSIVPITALQSFALQVTHSIFLTYYVHQFPDGLGYMPVLAVITLATTLTVYQLRQHFLIKWLPGPLSFLFLFFTLPPTTQYIVPLGIYLALAMFQSAVLLTQSNAIEFVARAEFKLRKATIPGHVIMRRAWDVRDLSQLQRPESVRCVYLSLRWRQLWRINQLEDMDAIQQMSENIGEVLRENLVKILPETNFYIDWASDTAEIAIIVTDTCSETLAAEAAIKVAHELLIARAEIHELHGYPSGLDVGISVGQVYLAVCGSITLQRTLVDGVAVRQAQIACEQAQALRSSGAYVDRIMLTRDTIDLLPPTYANMAIPAADQHWLITSLERESA